MLNVTCGSCQVAPVSAAGGRSASLKIRHSSRSNSAFRAFSSCTTPSSNPRFAAALKQGRGSSLATSVVRPSHVRGVATTASAAMKVAVTGAGGQTGGLVVKRLLDKECSVVAIGRSSQGLEQIGDQASSAIVDITAPEAAGQLKDAFQGVEALVIATSAKPQMKPQPEDAPSGPPTFFYPEGQMPEQVDYEGQLLQVDAAKAAGVKHVVLVSSMGGTDTSNRLNSLGNGQILVWKRKAEEYLKESGLTYTILHPGGLFNEPGGQREIVLGVDDQLLARAESEGTSRRIPRDDVAALAVAALFSGAAKNRSLDAMAKEPTDGTATEDFDALYANVKGDCNYELPYPEED